jgi:hypothetical protein
MYERNIIHTQFKIKSLVSLKGLDGKIVKFEPICAAHYTYRLLLLRFNVEINLACGTLRRNVLIGIHDNEGK